MGTPNLVLGQDDLGRLGALHRSNGVVQNANGANDLQGAHDNAGGQVNARPSSPLKD
jgi:hypothetical protein